MHDMIFSVFMLKKQSRNEKQQKDIPVFLLGRVLPHLLFWFEGEGSPAALSVLFL
jgi:hypothetical protein